MTTQGRGAGSQEMSERLDEVKGWEINCAVSRGQMKEFSREEDAMKVQLKAQNDVNNVCVCVSVFSNKT